MIWTARCLTRFWCVLRPRIGQAGQPVVRGARCVFFVSHKVDQQLEPPFRKHRWIQLHLQKSKITLNQRDVGYPLKSVPCVADRGCVSSYHYHQDRVLAASTWLGGLSLIYFRALFLLMVMAKLKTRYLVFKLNNGRFWNHNFYRISLDFSWSTTHRAELGGSNWPARVCHSEMTGHFCESRPSNAGIYSCFWVTYAVSCLVLLRLVTARVSPQITFLGVRSTRIVILSANRADSRHLWSFRRHGWNQLLFANAENTQKRQDARYTLKA